MDLQTKTAPHQPDSPSSRPKVHFVDLPLHYMSPQRRSDSAAKGSTVQTPSETWKSRIVICAGDVRSSQEETLRPLSVIR